MSGNFFKEKIVIHHSPFVEQDLLNAVKEQIKDRLDSQGLPHDPSVIEFNNLGPTGAGDVLTFAWVGEFFVAGPQNAGQSLGTVVHNNDVNVFLGKREAALGMMAKNFINGLGNIDLNATQVPSLQDVVRQINDFRNVFPRLEATRI